VTRVLTPNQELLVEELERLDPTEQCSGMLRRGDKMCVHGVICDLYSRLTGRGRWVPVPGGARCEQIYAFEIDGRGDTIEAPDEALEFFDIVTDPPPGSELIEVEDVIGDDDLLLMHENDERGLTFANLARAIRTCSGKVRE